MWLRRQLSSYLFRSESSSLVADMLLAGRTCSGADRPGDLVRHVTEHVGGRLSRRGRRGSGVTDGVRDASRLSGARVVARTEVRLSGVGACSRRIRRRAAYSTWPVAVAFTIHLRTYEQPLTVGERAFCDANVQQSAHESGQSLLSFHRLLKIFLFRFIFFNV